MATASWIKSVWSRRIALAVIVVAAWPLWHGYKQYLLTRNQANRELAAETFAEIWVATPRFRESPKEFDHFRDSLLDSRGLSSGWIELQLARLKDEPKLEMAFFKRVSILVDSLSAIEDSLMRESNPAADTIPAVDTATALNTSDSS